MLQFDFTNEYSWMREKIVSYKITVTPPSRDSLAAGRRRRAHACLKAVEDDLQTAKSRLETTTIQKNNLYNEVTKLSQALEDAKKAYTVAEKEEIWLQERKTLRLEQQKLLKQRLTKGWPDEVALKQNGK
jgi:chromosome segregation ATPase